ncbi:MAG: exodeoxyribonuclease VII large subunit, partial [Oscillospiraceae bacterium]|nr:exodeoxyribonuclease VII large subunit [Oscillospiraceae bacterium]
QGVEAPPEIVGAIKYANEFKVADVIITGRGGGSIEDLWAFNDERVARAIYESDIPVISAVGHEPDVTISDYVADLRASTPSNAAELAVPDWREMDELLSSYEIRSGNAVRKKLEYLGERLKALSEKRVMTDPTAHIDNRRIELDRMRDRLISAQDRKNAVRRQNFVRLAASLDAMSPLRVLSRGYAVVSDDNNITIKSISQLSEGEALRIRLSDGSAECRVESVFGNE